MLIKHTNYNNAGELLAPLPADLNACQPGIGGTPTTEPGYYHRFRFEGKTKAERLAKIRKFFSRMNDVPGYSTLQLKPYEIEVGSHYRAGMDIVYVIEAPGAR